jgi:hypothetical protein
MPRNSINKAVTSSHRFFITQPILENTINAINVTKSNYSKIEPKKRLIRSPINDKNRAFDPVLPTMLRAWDDVRIAIIEENND